MSHTLNTLIATMEAEHWDAILVTDPKHVYYITGFACDPHERFLGIVLAKGQEPVLIVPALDADKAAAVSSITRIATHLDTDNPYDILKQQLPDTIKTFGLEKAHMTVQRYESLQAVVQAEQYADIGAVLQSLRVIKSEEEIERLQAAVDCIETVLDNVVRRVRIGMTEAEVVADLEYEMKKQGAEGPSFSTMVLAGDNSALPHGVPGQRVIQAGDLLLFDLGVYLNGYASDITRTFAVGEISDELKEIYNTVLAANEAAIAAVRPGITYASLDQTARQVITDKGYGPYFSHRLGHGLGIDVHEYPSIHDQNEALLEPGHVFTIEPGVYVQGKGGVRIEDDVVVTKEGVRVLTSYPKQLTIIG
ncbi:Xaa-Pro peptidase family protein [Paenibacillus sp. ACRRX]|uniref:M24 family metallopeptidase n=1 Tax=Paenibacillus sp. ACRRX TaxID=2918206 RepID=UPI001EF60940|nr:Xaa-Pro peptidase family protein [Paenibacillus sp. ACRRX]MCG7408084.1 Xaa-Pro peptidase family protein [Paenibacillus sp. ACRRX]